VRNIEQDRKEEDKEKGREIKRERGIEGDKVG
jgi:hypothetical protein